MLSQNFYLLCNFSTLTSARATNWCAPYVASCTVQQNSTKRPEGLSRERTCGKKKDLTKQTAIIWLCCCSNSCLPLICPFCLPFVENLMTGYKKPLSASQYFPLIVKQSSPVPPNESDAVEQQAHRQYHHFQPV